MQTVKYYEVTYNSDSTEGRGATLSTGYAFKKFEDAVTFVESDLYKKFAVMGIVKKKGSEYSKFHVREVSLTLLDDFDEALACYKIVENNKLREAALKKLTPEERIALGFTE